jgi:AraC-like DNA-binding protein
MAEPTDSPTPASTPVATYTEYAPSDPLRGYVECFWTNELTPSALVASPPVVRRVLPDGCIDVVLGFSGHANDPESAMAVGTMTRALVLDSAGAPECFVGVRFRPAKAAAFIGVPAHELTNLRVSIDDIWHDGGEVREALAANSGAIARVRALERVLLARMPRDVPGQADVDEAIRRIVDAGGSLGITMLAPALGVTRQHLARRFSQLVGVSPKTFARVVRLGRVIERVRQIPAGEPVNWSTLALELGYYDQSHLVDEFKEMTGVTPTAWR